MVGWGAIFTQSSHHVVTRFLIEKLIFFILWGQEAFKIPLESLPLYSEKYLTFSEYGLDF